jgi:WD40 repeat protein
VHAERALHSNPCLVSSISHVLVFGAQIRTIGHNGEGDCICTLYGDGCVVETDDECPVTGHLDSVYSVAYSPDGKHIVSGSRDDTVTVWDSQTGEEVSVLVCHRPIVCCCVHCC